MTFVMSCGTEKVNFSLASYLYIFFFFFFQEHPGTEVHVIDLLHGWKSLAPLWYQVKSFYAKMLPIMQRAKDGIILIGN